MIKLLILIFIYYLIVIEHINLDINDFDEAMK